LAPLSPFETKKPSRTSRKKNKGKKPAEEWSVQILFNLANECFNRVGSVNFELIFINLYKILIYKLMADKDLKKEGVEDQ
jgi:hypothetical protein